MKVLLTFPMLIALVLSACSPHSASPSTVISPPETKLPADVHELSLMEAEALMKAKPDLVLLDMRVETEWAEEGHLPGAQRTNFYRDDLRGHLASMDRDKPYLVYCAIGERSKQTAVLMHELGFHDIAILGGGLNAWKAAGKPVEK